MLEIRLTGTITAPSLATRAQQATQILEHEERLDNLEDQVIAAGNWLKATEEEARGEGIEAADLEDDKGLTPRTGFALLHSKDYRWPIQRFVGGETEWARAESVADWQAVMNAALATGEKTEFSAGSYPIRSAGSGLNGVAVSGDIPVDWEAAMGAKIIPGEFLFGTLGTLMSFNGSGPDWSGNQLTPFRMKGFKVDGTTLALHGEGPGTGATMLSISRYASPLLEGNIFFNGFNPMVDVAVGGGYLETGVFWFGNLGARSINNWYSGFPDTANYVSANRYTTPETGQPANPIRSITAGVATFELRFDAHGFTAVGQKIAVRGATAVDGGTLLGEYLIASITDANFVRITASFNATVGNVTGGGSVYQFTNTTKTFDLYSNDQGADIISRGDRFRRNGTAFAIKNAQRGASIEGFDIRQCVNGILTSTTDQALIYARKVLIANGMMDKITHRPIQLHGGLARVHDVDITNYGAFNSDDGVTPTSGFGDVPAIDLRDAPRSKVHDNTISNPAPTWKAAIGTGGERRVGIMLGASVGYIDKTDRANVHHNSVDDCDLAYAEAVGNSDNNFLDNDPGNSTVAYELLGARTALRFPNGFTLPAEPVLKTIAAGVITVNSGETSIKLRNEGAAGTDNLDTITAGTGVKEGHVITLRTDISSQDAVTKHDTGNIRCGADITLSGSEDNVLLVFRNTRWVPLAHHDNI